MGIEYLGLSSINGPLVSGRSTGRIFLMRPSNLRLMEKRKKSEGSLNYTKIKQ